MEKNTIVLPAVALRGITILPGIIAHFDISRERTLNAIEKAMQQEQKVFLVSQQDDRVDDPGRDDLYDVGIIAEVKQVIKLQNDIVRILVDGFDRGRLVELEDCGDYYQARIDVFSDESPVSANMELAMLEGLKEAFANYSQVHGKVSKEVTQEVKTSTDLKQLIDYIANNLAVNYRAKQKVLQAEKLEKRYEELLEILLREIDVIDLKNDLAQKVKARIDKHQRDYYLREQLALINEQLGENQESEAVEFDKAIDKLNADDYVKERLHKEVKRFKNVNGSSSESAVSRTYIETLLELPWNNKTQDNMDLAHAEDVLNRDHFGLEKVKERILEFLAVRALTSKGEAPIICLVGPPGTGKTSIAKSIAEALGKKYVRISLGGVRDEAEIRGHRKTYVGAMPGRIINGIKMAGSANPLMLLDEIDKMSNDYKGDPSAALLEVLDSEQNSKFRDHYVEIPVNLSEVLFIATANSMDQIPKPLFDRMEIIEVSSYTENEKLHIAKDHLVEKQFRKNGISAKKLSISDSALKMIIHSYTREAGVRGLERKIGQVCRKAAKDIYTSSEGKLKISRNNLKDYLGQEKYAQDKKNDKDDVGIVRGLAWTSVGGVTLEVEVNVMPGKGELVLTGKLGDVMKESAMAGLSYIRSIADRYGIKPEYFKEHDIHIHIPEGATPKDGPSAGITMATAVLSAITGKKVRASVAMTGEITLRGRVLPIGGLKEKLLAAKNAGITTVCIPVDNKKDLEELSEEITGGMDIIPVDKFEQVIRIAII